MNLSCITFYLDSPLVKNRCIDIFEPEKQTCDTALFFIHGGGGARPGMQIIMEGFCRRGVLCASVGFRDGDALDQLKDVRNGYDRFLSYLKEKGLPLKVCVYGESHGAFLGSLLLCAVPGECGEKVDLANDWIPPVRGVLQATPVQFTPWTDINPTLWSLIQKIAGVSYEEHPERYEALSLRNYLRKDNPPLFFAEAQHEHYDPPAMTYALVQKHNAMGIPSQWKMYKNVEHGFFYRLDTWQQKLLFEDIFCFLNGNPVPISETERKRGELYLQMIQC